MKETRKALSRFNSFAGTIGKRGLSLLLSLIMLFAVSISAAEAPDLRQEILNQASALEAEKGKLRSVVVHVYKQAERGQPQEGEAPETAFLKYVSQGLEKMWQLSETESAEMAPEALLALYGSYTAAELDNLAQFRDVHLEDPLRNFLYHAYIAWLDRQAAAALDTANPVDAIWRWNEARQEGVRVVFFLNRYYEVPVHQDVKARMSSYLYEGAMLVDENTIESMLDQLGAEPLVSSDTADAASESDGAAASAQFGQESWQEEPTGKYEFRVYDFDGEGLSVQAELRDKATEKVVSRSQINLSVWEKYQKERQTLDTFYKVGEVEVQDEKVSFNLYANVRFDGRLFREIRGKISLRIPAAGASAGSTEADMADSNFPEAPISQDFTSVKVGDHLFMGYYEQDGNEENLREPIEWVVLSINKKKNIGIMVSVKGLEAASYGPAGNTDAELEPGFNWSSSALRTWLNGDFYETSFTAAEKSRIREATNITKDPSGRFTTKDYVFLLSAEEAKRYLHSQKGMACEPTAHAMAGLDAANGGIVEDHYCQWWLRELTSAVKVNRDGTLKKNTKNEAGYVSGTTGMRFYSRSSGLPVYVDNLAVVRPAMWVKFGEAE